jgi:hypothetical protein
MRTLLLDRTTWDLVLDSRGNLAVADDPYALAQDVASAIRTVQGEVYYDTEDGVPYFDQILGQAPPVALIKQYLIAAALTVPEIVSAEAFISSVKGREIFGQVQARTATGVVVAVNTGLGSAGPFVLDQSTIGGPNVLG